LFTFPVALNFADAALEQQTESEKERIRGLFQNLMAVLRPFQKLQLNSVNLCCTLRSEPGNRRQTICSKAEACKLASWTNAGDALKSNLELYSKARLPSSNKMVSSGSTKEWFRAASEEI